jgi:hypothetical protein
MNRGSYALAVEITSVDGSTADAGATVTAGNAALAASGVPVTGVQGFAIVDTVVATFTDANPNTTPSGYSAAVDWGDGTDPFPGRISVNPAGGFQVTGTHVYVDEGSYAVTVVIYDLGLTGASAGATATISDAPLTVKTMPITKVEGDPFSGVVATVTDLNPLSNPDELSVSIDWGDGATSSGVISPLEQAGSYSISGEHLYTNWGSYGFSVTVAETGGSAASAGGMADIADAPLTAVGRVITPTEGTAFRAVVANFSDANLYGTTNQFIASVGWGDGTTSSGSVIANTAVNTGQAEFVVLGSHTYANQGLYPIVVSVQSIGGSHTAAGSAAATADAPMIGYGKTINAVKGVAFTNEVATCVDTDQTPEPETTYNCIIDWGDGTTSTGTMIEGDEESYGVSGSHTYARAGSYVVLTTIDNMQSLVSTTARGTAVVSETPATNMTSQFVIKSGKPVYNKSTGVYRQTVTIRNRTRQAIGGPVSLVLDNLSNGGGSISLVNKNGETLSAGAAPVGSPYKTVALPKSNMFPAGNTRSVTLLFRSSSKTITYTPRVLAGPGAR